MPKSLGVDAAWKSGCVPKAFAICTDKPNLLQWHKTQMVRNRWEYPSSFRSYSALNYTRTPGYGPFQQDLSRQFKPGVSNSRPAGWYFVAFCGYFVASHITHCQDVCLITYCTPLRRLVSVTLQLVPLGFDILLGFPDFRVCLCLSDLCLFRLSALSFDLLPVL